MLVNYRIDSIDEAIKNDTELYTLDEARKVLELKKCISDSWKSRIRMYFLKQRLTGIVLISSTIFYAIISGDATIGIYVVPMGIWLLFTKKRNLPFRI